MTAEPRTPFGLPLPFIPRRIAFETDDSFVISILARNHYPATIHATLVRTLRRELTRAHPGVGLLEALTGHPTATRSESFGVVNRHISACSTCSKSVSDRWACRRCAQGRTIPQVPHLGPFVCRRHRLWVGPGTKPEEQVVVPQEVVLADRRLQRMFAQKRLDVPVMIELLDLFEARERLVGLSLTVPQRFVALTRAWSAVTNSLDILTDPRRPHAQRYVHLQRLITVSRCATPQSAPIVDGIWAVLRRAEIGRREIYAGKLATEAFSADHWPSGHNFGLVKPDDELSELTAYESCMITCKPNQWDQVNHLYVTERSLPGVRWAVSMTSAERISFACREGHRVTVPAANRRRTFNSQYCGCGVCSGRHALSGYNSISDTHPHVAERWHPTLNGAITPGDVRAGSSRTAWWLCRNGHQFEATINNMVRRDGRTCRYCTRRTVEIGVTGLDVTHPLVAQRWHPTRNGDLSAANVLSGSSQIVWWLCDAGHSYDLAVVLAASGVGCGVCRGFRAVAGVNTLQDELPEIAAQWHPTLNGTLSPDKVTPGSGKKAWWICDRGDEWEAPIFRRKTKGCPVCANLAVRPGVNSLADTHPELAAEWHPTYNGAVTSDSVVAGSPKNYWWQCPEGHPYLQALVCRRDGQGCIYCSKRKVWSGFNDACSRFPNLMKDWDYERNEDFDPSNRLPGGEKHFWRCSRSGHTAFSTIPNRRLTNGCPRCEPSDRAGFNGV